MRIAILISGAGTTLKNLLNCVAEQNLSAAVGLVVSSSSKAAGLQIAREAGVVTRVIRPRDHATPEAFSRAIFGSCRQANVRLVVMGGFVKFVPIPPDFENRVMNIHPSLIPAFSGQGYYGLRVHQAVLDDGAKVSGCTVHFVDNVYDHGPIILRRSIEVQRGDTAESLQRRIFAEECTAYPTAIQLFAAGRLCVTDRTVTVLPEVEGPAQE